MDTVTADQLGTWADDEAALSAYEQYTGEPRPTDATGQETAIASVASYLVDVLVVVEEQVVQYTYGFPDGVSVVIKLRAIGAEIAKYTP